MASRAAAQWPLLAAALGILVACAVLVGAGALLLTDGQARALAAAVATVDGVEGSGSPDLVTATMELERPGEGAPEDTGALLSAVSATMMRAVQPYPAKVSVWAASPMMYLPGQEPRLGYLLDADSVTEYARLSSGHWPRATGPDAPLEVAIPTTTAATLGLAVGAELRLTETPMHADSPPPAGRDLVVVGLLSPDGSTNWSRDPLHGEGFDSDWNRLPAYGPFVTVSGAFVAHDAPVGRVSVIADPDLAGDPGGLTRIGGQIGGLRTAIGEDLGVRNGSIVVRSDLPALITADRGEQNITGAIVVMVGVLVVALAIATLGLVGRLLVQRRADESALLAERGASTPQFVARAAVESLVLAALAIVLGIPLALAGYRAVVSLSPLGPSWKAASELPGPGLTGSLVAAVALGVLAPALALVLVAMRDHRARGRRRVPSVVTRSGADLLLAALAILGFIQLDAHRIGTSSIDPILVVAPVLCLVAAAALALRALPLVARLAEVRARRATGLVMPLAGWQIARGSATAGAFLMVLASASATFGIGFLGTWTLSQQDQADAALGADLVVGEQGPPSAGATISAVTNGVTVPVTSRRISLGSRPGGASVVALDTRRVATVMHGRLPRGETWESIASGLAPAEPVAAFTVTGDSGGSVRLVMSGSVTAPALDDQSRVTLTPTVVLEDAWGNRLALEASSTVADGTSHDVVVPRAGEAPLPPGTWSVVALDVRLDIVVEGGGPQDPNALGSVVLTVSVPGASSSPGEWVARAVGQDSTLKPLSIKTDGTTVTCVVELWVMGLVWTESHLALVGFTPVDVIPVVISDEAGRELNLAPGDPITLVVDTVTIHGRVLRRVPYITGEPRGAVVLADSDALSRAMLAAGNLGSLTDAWWVANPDAGAATELAARGLVPVETRLGTAEWYRTSPLRVALRAAVGVLVLASLVLAVAGTAAHAAAVAQSRSTEFARLRGAGVGRRALFGTALLQHLFVTGATVVVGAAVGALATWGIAPLLVVAEGGLRAVPSAIVSVSWEPLVGVLAVLFVGGFAVGLPAARALVWRSTALGLRMGDAS